jgi:hypothetical protein
VHDVTFPCARNGLAETLQDGLLGGYDGAGGWVITLPNIRGGDEQLMVEAHEGLHHELQASSGLGLIGAMSLLLAARGTRPLALKELFRKLAHDSRQTHELFATTLSASVCGVRQARILLRDNPVYLGYLERGLALGGEPGTAWRYRETAAAAVLRCCMAPAGVFDLLEMGFGKASRQSLPPRGGLPDERLAAYEGTGGADWRGLLDELATDYPDQLDNERDVDRRQLPEGPEELAALRQFDEDVLLRRCYERACGVLAGAGFPSVTWTEQEQVAHALRDAVGQADPELAQRLNIVTARRPVLDDGLEYDRQKVMLRDRLRAQVLDPAETMMTVTSFVAEALDGTAHACGVWLSRQVVEKQFAIPPDTRLPDLVVALLARTRAHDGSTGVRIGLLPPSMTPRECQDLLGDVPLLVVTSHFTLTDEKAARGLRRVEPVFVLMDLPVAWHVDDWIRQGASVRMALVPLEGVGAAELDMVAFTVDRARGFRFVCVGGRAGVSILVERLRRRHGEQITISGELVRADQEAFNLALNHVFGAWHVLDQDAVE